MSTTKSNHIEQMMHAADSGWCQVNDIEESGVGEEFIEDLEGVKETFTFIEETCKLLLAMQGIEVEDE